MGYMKLPLKRVAHYHTGKIETKSVQLDCYISTTNMLPEKAGITVPDSLPPAQKINEYSANDILISNIRPYFKKIWFADRDGGCDADILNIRANIDIIEPKFLYFALFNDAFFDYIMVGSKGVKMPRGDKSFIMNYEVPVPSIEEQRKIINLISPYFEKIESNRRLASNLFELSKLQFEKWFVDFNFPDYNGKPFKDNGGVITKIDGVSIPVDWNICKFDELVSFRNGINYSAEEVGQPNAKIISVKHLVRNSILSESIADSIFLSTEVNEDSKIRKFDTIVARSASPGESAIALDDLDVYYSGFSIRVRPHTETWRYITFFNTQSLKKLITSHSDGTIIKNITQQTLSNFKIVTPPEQVVENFNRIVEPILFKMNSLNKENNILIETRELLIHKLIK